MIIYGSRMYGKSAVVEMWGSCDHCGRYTKQSCYDGKKFGHIYFIPLIPMGGKVRVLFECSNCNMGSHVPHADVPDITQSIRQGLRPALEAASAGKTTYVDADGDTVHTGAQLAGAVAMLYACGTGDDVDRLLDALPEGQARCLVEAAEHECAGNAADAIDAYKRAAAADRDDVVPLMMLGELCSNRGKYEEARDVYEKALEMEPESFGIVAHLADIAEALKDWDGLCDHYETLFAAQPQFAADKKLVKTYKKACKKAKRDPVALQ